MGGELCAPNESGIASDAVVILISVPTVDLRNTPSRFDDYFIVTH